MNGSATDTFIERLRASSLLDEGQLQEMLSLAQAAYPPEILARRIVQSGWVTPWQSEQLLQGHTRFHLGKYQLLDMLGKGGMGTVYKAKQTTMQRMVALKVMAHELMERPDAVARFQREVCAVAQLNHPYIVTAYDSDRTDNIYYLAMEYVDGFDLETWISNFGKLPLQWSCECIRQASLGLQHAHERGLVHRDIKPSNLLVVAQSTLHFPMTKILDLGIARLARELTPGTALTQTGQMIGTPDFIAPEQAQNSKEADIRADIFSLGCTLYHMLTGELPFTGNNPVEKLVARFNNAVPPVKDLRPDVPDGVNEIVLKMTRKNPAERYSHPREIAEAILPFCLPNPHHDVAGSSSVILDHEDRSAIRKLKEEYEAGQNEAHEETRPVKVRGASLPSTEISDIKRKAALAPTIDQPKRDTDDMRPPSDMTMGSLHPHASQGSSETILEAQIAKELRAGSNIALQTNEEEEESSYGWLIILALLLVLVLLIVGTIWRDQIRALIQSQMSGENTINSTDL
ncbi:Serine/threonine protein kinase [Planctomycetales bacterium 10988]|nr:Serine/threonine protein kinase [Planctomycetales bacterium 10988]